MIYSVPWDTSNYLSGKHKLSINICLNDSRCYNHERKFTLNGDSKIYGTTLGVLLLTFDFSVIPSLGFWIELILLWLSFPLLAYIHNKVISVEPQNKVSNSLIIKQRSEMYEIYFKPSDNTLKSLYKRELCNYIVYKLTLFFNRKWTRYYYYFVMFYIPIFPILFQQTFSKHMYLWGRYGSIFLFKGQLFNSIDGIIMYGAFMMAFWFPSILYFMLFNNFNDIKELKSKFLKWSLLITKVIIGLIVFGLCIFFLIVFTIFLLPDSLFSPITFNAIYVLLCMMLLR